ncbi:MAG: (2Fe-2S) ferredoxin domain-containing protein [Candidatus Sericytochromatia bacterium]|nr:(2Fe-2S) ferredoxin domain-containing protein [Candidatus Sericytochromatia bacterium]
MSAPEHHIFVCQNERAAGHPRGCCKANGSADVLGAFKTYVAQNKLRSRVEFDGTTCVDTCAWGPVVIVYPQGTWYGKVTPKDAPEIIQAILEGRTVERLLISMDAIRKS